MTALNRKAFVAAAADAPKTDPRGDRPMRGDPAKLEAIRRRAAGPRPPWADAPVVAAQVQRLRDRQAWDEGTFLMAAWLVENGHGEAGAAVRATFTPAALRAAFRRVLDWPAFYVLSPSYAAERPADNPTTLAPNALAAARANVVAALWRTPAFQWADPCPPNMFLFMMMAEDGFYRRILSPTPVPEEVPATCKTA